jgi:hypothetical protein
MRTEMVQGTRSSTGAGSRPDRRAFLRVGAGCAVPLLAGGMVASRGLAGSAEAAAPGSTGQDAVDPVLAHIEQELARTYHAMRGPAGIRGEHVRSLAANLELVGVCLESNRAAARAEAAIRRHLAERGREATVQDSLAAYDRLFDDLALQHGIAPGRPPDAAQLAAALDTVAAKGLRLNLRGHKARLSRLATEVDRAGAMRDAHASPRLVRQKPGDDFPSLSEIMRPGAGMTLCEFLAWLEAYLDLVAVALALGGLELPAGILAMLGVLIGALQLQPCKKDAEV